MLTNKIVGVFDFFSKCLSIAFDKFMNTTSLKRIDEQRFP